MKGAAQAVEVSLLGRNLMLLKSLVESMMGRRQDGQFCYSVVIPMQILVITPSYPTTLVLGTPT